MWNELQTYAGAIVSTERNLRVLTTVDSMGILHVDDTGGDALHKTAIGQESFVMPELQTAAPSGARFEYEEVKTAKGAESLGHVPILIWDNLDAAVAHYGEEGVRDVLDGTSLRVSFQNIARRFKAAGKSDEEIAQAEINFKPGKRAGGVSTPASRAARLAKSATEKVGGDDSVEKLLAAIAEGKISGADIAALVS